MSQLEQLQSEPGTQNRDSSARILSPELMQQFETLRNLLQRALWLAERCADIESTQILRARLTNLQAAALLVVVGEVKAGKSSFINALLREDVCEVAPGPCTVRIQELIYGPERRVERTAVGEVVAAKGERKTVDRGDGAGGGRLPATQV